MMVTSSQHINVSNEHGVYNCILIKLGNILEEQAILT